VEQASVPDLRVPDLEDDELRLRPPERRDVDAVTVACQDPDISRFTRIPSPYERAHAEGWIAHSAEASSARSV
jgi:RimJ/RimL family protein N-acetyltransferase